jgi:hypothetical protein
MNLCLSPGIDRSGLVLELESAAKSKDWQERGLDIEGRGLRQERVGLLLGKICGVVGHEFHRSRTRISAG